MQRHRRRNHPTAHFAVKSGQLEGSGLTHRRTEFEPPSTKNSLHAVPSHVLVAQVVKSPPECGRPGFNPWIRKVPWRRKWQPTPIFSPGQFHGQRSLAGYSPWCHKELDTTEQLTLSFHMNTLSPLYMNEFQEHIHKPNLLSPTKLAKAPN